MKNRTNINEYLLNSGIFLTILTVPSYLYGAVYLDAYFKVFHINIHLLQLSTPEIIESATSPILMSITIILLGLIFSGKKLIKLLLKPKLDQNNKNGNFLFSNATPYGLGLIVLLAIYLAGGDHLNDVAKKDAINTIKNPIKTKFISNGKTVTDWYYLTQTSDHYYFFKPNPDGTVATKILSFSEVSDLTLGEEQAPTPPPCDDCWWWP